MAGLDDFGLIGGAINAAGSIWGGMEEAGAYRKEAGLYKQAAEWTKYSTGIKELALNRQTYQVLGAGRSDIGASGLKLSGSGADVMRASAGQAAVSRNLIGLQGRIDEQGYLAQETAANEQANAAELSGFMQGAGHIADSISGPLMAMGGF